MAEFGAMAPFRLERPSAEETPLLVEIPHAGLHVDAASLAVSCAPLRAVGRDADLLVDQLFQDAPDFGASLLVATHSRFVVDLNRGPGEVDGMAVENGSAQPRPRGLIWRTTTENDPILLRRLSSNEFERRLTTFYRPYHEALQRELDRKRERFGFAIILCAHSMPSTGRRGHIDVGAGRADVVPGSRGRTSAAEGVIDCVDGVSRRLGFSVKHDDPYRGGFSTGHYGRPREGQHAIQIELARRLYMDEDLLVPNQGFDRTRGLARELVRSLAAFCPEGSA